MRGIVTSKIVAMTAKGPHVATEKNQWSNERRQVKMDGVMTSAIQDFYMKFLNRSLSAHSSWFHFKVSDLNVKAGKGGILVLSLLLLTCFVK